MVKIYWIERPLQSESIRVAKLMRYEYEAALKKDLTDELKKELILIAKSKLNFIGSWFGVQGSGKSYQAIKIWQIINEVNGTGMELKNCAFTISDLLKVVENCDKGDTFMLDEQVHQHGYGSMVERHLLENIEMTVRKYRLSFLFLAPKFISHNYHYFFETWLAGSNKPVSYTKPIEEQWKYTKSVIFDHRDHMLGHIITGGPTNKKFLEKYEKAKDKFISKVVRRRGSGRHQYILDKAYKLLEDDEFFKAFIICRTKRLKRLVMIAKGLKGEIMGIQEQNMLLDYLDYICDIEPKFKIKKRKILKGGRR